MRAAVCGACPEYSPAMARNFRFGVQCMSFGDPDAVMATAKACAEHGYDEFYTADHLGHPDPFAPLLVAAMTAPELRVGPLVVNNAFHNPALLARSAATIDRLTGGRFVMGLGTGYAQSEHDAIGIPLPRPGDRVVQFEESIVALRGLLESGSATVQGEQRLIDVDDLGVQPVQERVPFLIGGHGRRVVGIAGRHADIFQFTGLTHGPDGTPGPGGFALGELVQRRAWLEASAGDRIGDIECSALVQRLGVGDDTADEADEIAEKWGLSAEEFADCPFALFGSVEQLVDKLERLRETLGISHYVVRDAEGFAPVVAALDGH